MPRIPGLVMVCPKHEAVARGGRGSDGNDGMGHLNEPE